jgi:hypothetical protein
MASDVDIEEFADLCEQAGQGDLAVAVRDIYEAVEDNYPDEEAVSEATEQVTLPFHDENREAAFTLGLTFGVILEQDFPEDGDDAEDAAVETEATVEAEQSQETSVTIG